MNLFKLDAQHKVVYFVFLSLLFSVGSFAEEVKVVTYYPAPYSEYKELNTTQNTNLATNTAAVSGVPTYKVGIGTSAPAQKLDVDGNVKFSGALMPNGSAGTSGQVLTSQGAAAAPIWAGSSQDYGKISKTNWQNIPTNVNTEITFNRLDFGSGVSRTGNRLLISTAGVYVVTVEFPAYLVGTAAGYGNKFYACMINRYASGSVTPELLSIKTDATPPVVAPGSATDGWVSFQMSEVVKLQSGDQIAVAITHAVPTNASTSLNVVGYPAPNVENSASLAVNKID